MKKRNGFTLLELLICITLVSIVVIFLYKLLSDIQNEDYQTPYIKANQENRNEIMKTIGLAVANNTFCKIETSKASSSNGTSNIQVTLLAKNGLKKIMNIDVTKSEIAIDFDGYLNRYVMKAPHAYYDPNFTITEKTYENYKYFKLDIKTEQKGLNSSSLDDIELYFITTNSIDPRCTGVSFDELYNEQEYLDLTSSGIVYTSYYPTDNTRIQSKFSYTAGNGSHIIGAPASSETDSFRFIVYTSNTLYLDYGSGQNYNRIYSSETLTPGLSNLYNIEIGNRYVLNLDNNEYYKLYESPSNAPATYTVPSRVSFATKSYVVDIKGARFYYLTIYDGNNLVSNMVPCKRNSDGHLGMCDYGNQEYYPVE